MALLNFPIGTVIFWENTTIPSGWQVCDGTNGTLNLVSKFPCGASIDGDLGTGGGATTHTHSTSVTDNRLAHNHGGSISGSVGGGSGIDQTIGSGENPASTDHSHGVSATIGTANQHAHAVGTTGSTSSMPRYISRVLIQRMT